MDRIAVLIPCYNEELSIAGVIAALQSFFTGLILHHIAQHNRKDMELRLVTLHDVLANMKRNGS